MFQNGDILIGTKRKFEEAYHPIIFIGGSDYAPLAVVLTHSDKYPCNVRLVGNYGENSTQYFIAHLIEKLPEWGPYSRVGKLTDEDIKIVRNSVSSASHITWQQYEEYTKNSCPDHG